MRLFKRKLKDPEVLDGTKSMPVSDEKGETPKLNPRKEIKIRKEIEKEQQKELKRKLKEQRKAEQFRLKEQSETHVILQQTAELNKQFATIPKRTKPKEFWISAVSEALAPGVVDETNKDYLIIDNMYVKTFLVTDYPESVGNAWLSSLMSLGENTEVSFRVIPINREEMQRKNASAIRMNKLSTPEKSTRNDIESVGQKLEASSYIKQMINRHGENAFDMILTVAVYAYTEDDLYFKVGKIHDYFQRYGFELNDCVYLQPEAFQANLPCGIVSDAIYDLGRRNILSNDLSSAFPFTSLELREANGIYLGQNHNGSMIVLDPYNREVRTNGNIFIEGASGAGKTFTLQLILLRLRMQKVQSYTIAHLKADEYKRACDAIGGTYIRIAPGSPNTINALDIRHQDTEIQELILGESFQGIGILAKKIQRLRIFFELLMPDIQPLEKEHLETALMNVYARKGITMDDESLWADLGRTRYKIMPTMEDLYEEMKNNQNVNRLAPYIYSMVHGANKFMNGQTNVDLNNPYIVFDLSDLSGNMEHVCNYMCFEMIETELGVNKTKQKAIVMDELWYALSNEATASHVEHIWRIIRGLGGIAIGATQRLMDCFEIANGKYGKAVLGNSAIKILMKSEEMDARELQRHLNLTDEEVLQIFGFGKGDAIIYSNQDHVQIHFEASELEAKLISTDAESYENYANEQRELREQQQINQARQVADQEQSMSQSAPKMSQENPESIQGEQPYDPTKRQEQVKTKENNNTKRNKNRRAYPAQRPRYDQSNEIKF
ncbi:MAG: VirB4 family type IV secretion system protein [Fastidiosipilaceae bacterium]|jgi:conjugal transfer ATP-binding protein TraC